MSVITSIVSAIWELFVDDGSLAALILVWCGIGGWGLPALGVTLEWQALLLATGLFLILAENVLRSAQVLGRRK
jgi:hypothetical protein